MSNDKSWTPQNKNKVKLTRAGSSTKDISVLLFKMKN
jgi:hypothetical protein